MEQSEFSDSFHKMLRRQILSRETHEIHKRLWKSHGILCAESVGILNLDFADSWYKISFRTAANKTGNVSYCLVICTLCTRLYSLPNQAYKMIHICDAWNGISSRFQCMFFAI